MQAQCLVAKGRLTIKEIGGHFRMPTAEASAVLLSELVVTDEEGTQESIGPKSVRITCSHGAHLAQKGMLVTFEIEGVKGEGYVEETDPLVIISTGAVSGID